MTRPDPVAAVPPAARAHRDRVVRERAALVTRLARPPLRRFRAAILAASRSRADAFGAGFTPDERRELLDARTTYAIGHVLAGLARARRVDLATVALIRPVLDVGTGEELRGRAEFVAFLDAAAEAGTVRLANLRRPSVTTDAPRAGDQESAA